MINSRQIKNFCFAIILAGNSGSLFAQNLVPNPSLETITSCPIGLSQIPLATPWQVPPGSITTPDLFNTCNVTGCSVDVPNNFMGVSNAFSGVGYMGLIMGNYGGCQNWKENIILCPCSHWVRELQYCVSF